MEALLIAIFGAAGLFLAYHFVRSGAGNSRLNAKLYDDFFSRIVYYDFVGARGIIEKVRKLDSSPNISEAWYLAYLGRYDEATKAAGVFSNFFSATQEMNGVLSKGMHHINAAKTHYDRAILTDPKPSPWVYYRLWEIAISEGNFDEAETIKNQGISVDPEGSTAFDLMFDSALLEFDIVKAKSILEGYPKPGRNASARLTEDFQIGLINARSKVADAEGRSEEALGLYGEILNIRPYYLSARWTAMGILIAAYEFDRAWKYALDGMVISGATGILNELGLEVPEEIQAPVGQPLVNSSAAFFLVCLAYQAVARGELKLASSCADKALEIEPYSDSALAVKSIIAMVAGTPDEQLDFAAMACLMATDNSKNAIAFLILSQRYRPQRKWPGLDPDEICNRLFSKFSEGHKRFPSNPKYTINLALLAGLNDARVPLDLLRPIHARFPRDIYLSYILATQTARAGDLDTALSIMKSVSMPLDVCTIVENYSLAQEWRSRTMLEFTDWVRGRMDPNNKHASLIEPHRDAAAVALKSGSS